MKQDYIINITGKQLYDNDDDIIEVTTLGHYSEKTTGKYIVYKEYDEDAPDDRRTAVVKVEGKDKVTIIRTGKYSSQLTLERNKRHQCHYRTVAGDLMIGVFTNKMNIDLDETGGTLEVGYTIDFNSDLMSENEFKIILRKTDKNQEISTNKGEKQ